MRKAVVAMLGGIAASLLGSTAIAGTGDVVKIGVIDPMSGPFAEEGLTVMRHLTFAAEKINEKYGVNIEIVPLDNALSVETSLQRLRQAADEGIRYITAGAGSNYVEALIKEIARNNERDPDNRMLILNHSGAAMSFTEEMCSFYHFRFEANVGMMATSLVTAIGGNEDLTKVYMQNMDYSYGQNFAASARSALPERAPNIEVVGDELIPPFGKIQDFTPYIAKIRSSGADTVLSSSFGPDLNRLVVAGLDAGLDVDWYMRSAYNSSSLPVFGKLGEGRVYATFENNINDDAPKFLEAWAAEFQERNEGRSWVWDRQRMMLDMLAQSMVAANSTDVVEVAKALENASVDGQYGPVTMRAQDHQIQFAMAVGRTTTDFKLEQDKSGVGFETVVTIPADRVSLPSSCQMTDRPE